MTSSSHRNDLIEHADEAPGSETETFPNSSAAPMSTSGTNHRPREPRHSRHLGHRAFCDADDEEEMRRKQHFDPAAQLIANSLHIQVLDQFTGPKWAR
jgi:hypothetical protein